MKSGNTIVSLGEIDKSQQQDPSHIWMKSELLVRDACAGRVVKAVQGTRGCVFPFWDRLE